MLPLVDKTWNAPTHSLRPRSLDTAEDIVKPVPSTRRFTTPPSVIPLLDLRRAFPKLALLLSWPAPLTFLALDRVPCQPRLSCYVKRGVASLHRSCCRRCFFPSHILYLLYFSSSLTSVIQIRDDIPGALPCSPLRTVHTLIFIGIKIQHFLPPSTRVDL